MTASVPDSWSAAEAYEAYMGRWSRTLCDPFLRWLDPAPRSMWLEVGCGTGALSSAICAVADPRRVVACDASPAFAQHAALSLSGQPSSVVVASAPDLPVASERFDFVVSGLVLNFIPDPLDAVVEMAARSKPDGIVAAYVWDYAGGMEFLRHFWDEAVALDERAAELDEGPRFPICSPQALAETFDRTHLTDVETTAVDVATVFRSFSDYWNPFLGGTGPAPAYVHSLDAERREALRQRLEQRLVTRGSDEIPLTARAWAVRGTKS